MERLKATAALIEAGSTLEGTGSPALEALAIYWAPEGDGSHRPRGPTSWGTGMPALEAANAYGALAGDGSPHWRGPTSWETGSPAL